MRGVVGKEHAQAGHGEVEVAVAVEIDGMDVCGAWYLGEAALGESSGRRLPQPGDAVGGGVGCDDVDQPVGVEIDDRHVGDHRPVAGADAIADRLGPQEVDSASPRRTAAAAAMRLG